MSLNSLSAFAFKPNPSDLFNRSIQERVDQIVYLVDIVRHARDLLFVLRHLLRQFSIGRNHTTELDERSYNDNVNLDSAFAFQDAGQHRYAMFRKSEWRLSKPHPERRIGYHIL